ncbi:MAG: hypothetical protein ACRDPO_15660 [Streptosporangiaceae bacterium]
MAVLASFRFVHDFEAIGLALTTTALGTLLPIPHDTKMLAAVGLTALLLTTLQAGPASPCGQRGTRHRGTHRPGGLAPPPQPLVTRVSEFLWRSDRGPEGLRRARLVGGMGLRA